MDCDMRETYTFHRRVLKLLQWHCPPILWHLKTPVHMFALDALVEAYPNAKFLWSHRDPAKVMGSVCSLIRYVRSWSSDRDDPEELGAEQLDSWAEGIRRAMDFRKRVGDDRFADVAFADLQTDPVEHPGGRLRTLGLDLHRRHRAFGRAVGPRAQARLPRRTRLRPGRLRPDARGRPRTVRGVPRAPTTRAHDRDATHAATRTSSLPTPTCAAPSWPPRRNLFASKEFEGSASLRSLIAPS